MTDLLHAFMVESNRIVGIHETTLDEVAATRQFIERETVGVDDIRALVSVYQPTAVLRDRPGLNVRVGNHIAPKGGIRIRTKLGDLLYITTLGQHPWVIHQEYETLHPFTDGNGRSGRALWARQMVRQGIRPGLELGFLHAFYYQTLERSRT